jgi:peptidoglycan/LPS O-acetylase OafA/YrhL
MFFANGAIIVQSFFVMSGFLTAFTFKSQAKKEKRSTLEIFTLATLLRYIRLVPLLGLTVLVHSTWLYRLGSGPLWDRIAYTDRKFCRQNWWTTVFFLENYINVHSKCLIHTWYLAVDFWLSAAAILFLILIMR